MGIFDRESLDEYARNINPAYRAKREAQDFSNAYTAAAEGVDISGSPVALADQLMRQGNAGASQLGGSLYGNYQSGKPSEVKIHDYVESLDDAERARWMERNPMLGRAIVQDSFRGQNGNKWVLTKDGKTYDTGVKMGSAPTVQMVNGVPMRIDPQSGSAFPVMDPEEVFAGKMWAAHDAAYGQARGSKPTVTNINGVPYAQDPVTGALTPLADKEEVFEDAGYKKMSESTGTAQGTAAVTKATDKPKDIMSVNLMRKNAGNIHDHVGRASNLLSQLTAGFLASSMELGPLTIPDLRNIGGFGARDLAATLETIKANLGFDRLQQMREMSKTGGALGQVTEKELDRLEASIASLDQAQSAEQLARNLQNIQNHYTKVLQLSERMYQERHGEKAPDWMMTEGPKKVDDKEKNELGMTRKDYEAAIKAGDYRRLPADVPKLPQPGSVNRFFGNID